MMGNRFDFSKPLTVPPIISYSVGLLYMSVCALREISPEQIEAEANAQTPTGLDHGWTIDDAGQFKDGNTNPCPCNHEPDRQHWLLSC